MILEIRRRLPYANFFAFLIFLIAASRGNAQAPQQIIDSIKAKIGIAVPADKYIGYCFTIADNFMEIDLYDSSQLWLNKIAEALPLKQPTVANYFLSTRQAEVYYYNGLQRLGLQESERSLSIAQALNDSILLADSYNFLGLFYINLDSFRKAIPYFKKGMEYARQPPYPSGYLSLTKPHHLYGNMAEAYEKLHLYDSTVYFSRVSLQLATMIGVKRGIAVAHNNLGRAYLHLKQPDSSVVHYNLSRRMALVSGDFDVELIDYAGLARNEDFLQNKIGALQWLERGFTLISVKPFVNNLFTGQFLDDAIVLYEKYNERELLAKALKIKSTLLEQRLADNNRQVNVILNAGLKNETRLLNLEVKEANQRNEIANSRVYLLVSLIVLLIAAFVAYRYKVKQKIQIVQLQNKISQDLHDDVGSSLSSMQVYSTVAGSLIDKEPARAKEMLKKISKESSSVMENIGDIVWSMKTENEQGLSERIKNFVSDVLGAANIHYRIFIEEGIESSIRNIEARKNILLIIKEAVNNAVRHSKASHVSVNIKKLAGQLCVQITDDGIGMDKENLQKKGGLTNMQKRTLASGGLYEIMSGPGKGTTIAALFPLTKISDSR
jgi:signal transduction histidine kinase